MNQIELLAKSTTNKDEPYTVTFLRDDKGLRIVCTCRAGEFGRLCKHKFQLATGNEKMLFDRTPKQIELLEAAVEWVGASPFPELFRELRKIESQVDALRKELKARKAMLGRIMTGGLK